MRAVRSAPRCITGVGLRGRISFVIEADGTMRLRVPKYTDIDSLWTRARTAFHLDTMSASSYAVYDTAYKEA
jgi:hypothetical protein